MTVVQQKAPKVTHVDRPEVLETFADSIHAMVWDGQLLRVEFSVTRYPEDPSSPAAEAKRYPACRMVLSAPVVADLFNRLQQTMGVLTKAAPVSTPKPSQTEPERA